MQLDCEKKPTKLNWFVVIIVELRMIDLMIDFGSLPNNKKSEKLKK